MQNTLIALGIVFAFIIYKVFAVEKEGFQAARSQGFGAPDIRGPTIREAGRNRINPNWKPEVIPPLLTLTNTGSMTQPNQLRNVTIKF
jgi:hypothetical protein